MHKWNSMLCGFLGFHCGEFRDSGFTGFRYSGEFRDSVTVESNVHRCSQVFTTFHRFPPISDEIHSHCLLSGGLPWNPPKFTRSFTQIRWKM